MKFTSASSRRIHLRSASKPRVNLPVARLDQLKRAVRRRLLETFEQEVPVSLIRRALDEAEEVARSTGFPHLFLPELAAEQVRRVSRALHGDHSQRVRQTSVTDITAAVAA